MGSLSRMLFRLDGRSEIGRYLGWLASLLLGCLANAADKVELIENEIYETAENVSCYIVKTPTATYYLEKEGGGLSSMLDVNGVDWIGFHKAPGSESKGEYRGFPNAIHRQDGSYFHALNAGTDLSTSRVVSVSDNSVRIEFISSNEKWRGSWIFTSSQCTFIMSEVSEGFQYWVLYEGVPGGELDKNDFWYSSIDDKAHSIDERNDIDLPNPEWIAFGDPKSPRMLFLRHLEDDDYPDRYYNMRGEMTVFGFGREGGKKFLDIPQIFSIGFVESTDYEVVMAKAAR